MAPGGSEFEGATLQVDNSWYRIVFAIVNNGNEAIENETLTSSITIYKVDSNEDGTLEPIDISSLRVFVDGSEADWTLQSYTEDDSKIIAVMSGRIGRIEPGQTKKGYVYYLVGDDYE